MKYRELTRRLEAFGCHELPRHGSGSHRKWTNPGNERVTVIPDWGVKDLKIGTLRAIIRQLGLDWDKFNTMK